MTGVGRYVFTPAAFDVIDTVERTLTEGKELDDIPVMQMMLAEGNHVVLIFRPGVNVSRGQELTVFNSIRLPESWNDWLQEHSGLGKSNPAAGTITGWGG